MTDIVEQGASCCCCHNAHDCKNAEIERLQLICADTIKHLEEAEAKIEQKSADLTTLAQRLIERDDEIEQLKNKLSVIEEAATAAYRYHMLGYKDAGAFNANEMLDRMNKLGEVL